MKRFHTDKKYKKRKKQPTQTSDFYFLKVFAERKKLQPLLFFVRLFLFC